METKIQQFHSIRLLPEQQQSDGLNVMYIYREAIAIEATLFYTLITHCEYYYRLFYSAVNFVQCPVFENITQRITNLTLDDLRIRCSQPCNMKVVLFYVDHRALWLFPRYLYFMQPWIVFNLSRLWEYNTENYKANTKDLRIRCSQPSNMKVVLFYIDHRALWMLPCYFYFMQPWILFYLSRLSQSRSEVIVRNFGKFR